MGYKETAIFSPASIDACGYWRMWLPHLNIENSKFMFSSGTPPMNEITESDVLIVQRLYLNDNVKFLKMCREFGMRIVYDLDDNVWQLPRNNPAYQYFGTPEIQEGFLACAEWANVITCSTRTLRNVLYDHMGHLSNAASKKDIPIYVIDNAIDLKQFSHTSLPKDEDFVTIGWGGSNTHLGDIAEVWNLLPEIINKYPFVKMEFVGHDPPKAIIGHPRVKTRQYCHISEFAARYSLWNWDIVLAPLENHKFNKSKSNIKAQEAAAISSPCLCEAIHPYEYFVEKTPELKWLLCGSIYDWKKKLCELIENKSLRKDLGIAMHENLKAHFSIDRTKEEWKQVINVAFNS